MRRRLVSTMLAGLLAGSTVAAAQAQPLRPWSTAPFSTPLSNNTPLAFGLPVDDAARALGVPLAFVSGPHGNEIYLAIRDVGGSGLFDRRDRLFLQFRKGRLTGWKGDWGRNWMWQ
ncbi:hypothetical protein [Tardiphaga sp.]|uniref:hypothetical protein n=1 Tax=Tardiphaga sp. TaxID=1926292 RepID=UPI00260E2157|nr:hypothetical protein [Tardiphaga sp.]MDB5617005.1 hypothetical protein [Tardiphaga sp.]